MKLVWCTTGYLRWTYFAGSEIKVVYNNVRSSYFVLVDNREVSTGFPYPADAMKWIEGMIS